MNKEELKIWFYKQLNNCYKFETSEYEDSIFYMYDNRYIRYKKICKIKQIKEGEFKPEKIIKENILFEIDRKNKVFYCNDDKIWSIFYDYTMNLNYSEVQSFIKELLTHAENMSFIQDFNQYTPQQLLYEFELQLDNITTKSIQQLK